MGFLEVYKEWVGETDTPSEYFIWSGISLIAACLQDRVYTSTRIGAREIRVVPNLYTLLLGPSGNGKSLAVESAMSILRRTSHGSAMNLYEGKTTAPAMYENMMSNRRKPKAPYIYVVNDELANDIGMGEYAGQFIKSLTRLYLGAPLKDSTVTRGSYEIPHPYCVNWLACTTREWLSGTVDRAAILGGFFARVVVVDAGYTGLRVIDPPRPDNWDEMDKWLLHEVERYLKLDGEFKLTPEAREQELEFLRNQPLPSEDDPMSPTRRREHSLILKVATVLAVANGSDHLIGVLEWKRAVKLVREVSKVIPELADFVVLNQDAILGNDLLDIVKKNGSISHYKLARVALSKGIRAKQFKEIVESWEQAGIVERAVAPKAEGGTKYVWKTNP